MLPERPNKDNKLEIALPQQQHGRTDNNNNSNPTSDNNLNGANDADACAAGADAHKADGVADIVGEYGIYQLSLTIITFLRYVGVAMMTNAGSLLAPNVDFWCVLPSNITSAQIAFESATNQTVEDYLHNRCHIDTVHQRAPYQCERWTFSKDAGVTLTDTFELVCERNWLRSAFQSIVSVGVVVAAVAWGSFSDRHGRNFTVRVCFVWSLAMGLISYYANNFLLYAVARSLCSFGDLGLVASLSTIVVELLGNRYRGAVIIIVYTGWAFGVMIMPWITGYYQNYRHVMLFTVAFHALTGLWLMTIHESPRWLLTNGRIEEAREEMRRVVLWQSNFLSIIPFRRYLRLDQYTRLDEVDWKFDRLKPKYMMIAERNKAQRMQEKLGASRLKLCCLSFLGGLDKVGQLFKSFELIKTTMTLIWTTFNSELMYMFFIMINSDIGNLELNYLIGGIMETVASVLSIFMIAAMRRKVSLTFTLTTIACLCLALAFTHQLPSVSPWILNSTKLAISTLSSLIYVTTTEIFPTNVRQTGFGLTGTIGSLGAVVAPFMRTELNSMIGLTNVMVILFLLTMSAALTIPFLLRETKGVEIPDDEGDIETVSETNESQIDTHQIVQASNLTIN